MTTAPETESPPRVTLAPVTEAEISDFLLFNVPPVAAPFAPSLVTVAEIEACVASLLPKIVAKEVSDLVALVTLADASPAETESLLVRACVDLIPWDRV